MVYLRLGRGHRAGRGSCRRVFCFGVVRTVQDSLVAVRTILWRVRYSRSKFPRRQEYQPASNRFRPHWDSHHRRRSSLRPRLPPAVCTVYQSTLPNRNRPVHHHHRRCVTIGVDGSKPIYFDILSDRSCNVGKSLVIYFGHLIVVH